MQTSEIRLKNEAKMSNPFQLMGRLMLAVFKIGGYGLVCAFQCVWYTTHGRKDQVGEAVGYFGRGVTDAIASIFQTRK